MFTRPGTPDEFQGHPQWIHQPSAEPRRGGAHLRPGRLQREGLVERREITMRSKEATDLWDILSFF